MGFGDPQLLPLTGVAVLVAAVYAWAARRRRMAERTYAGGFAERLRAASFSSSRLWLKAGLVVLGVALLGVAVARPQIGTHHTLLQREGTDVVVAFDVSVSMSATDVQPSRLERAKSAVSTLLTHLGGDRVGLVTFAGTAQLRFPLTTDTEAARKVVQSLTLKDGGLGVGTSIGAALRQTSEGFAQDQTRSKVVILVSDGEDLGDDAAGAATFVHSEGIALYTIGVGHDSPWPLYTTDPRNGQSQPRIVNGAVETTTADPGALQQLAADNRGHFYNGNDDGFAVQLADEIDRLQKTRFESGQGDAPLERYQWFAGAGFALLLLEFLVPAGRSGAVARRRFRLRRGRGTAAPATERAPVPTGGD